MSELLSAPFREALATRSPADLLAAALQHFTCQTGTVHLLREGVLRLAAQVGLPPHLVPVVDAVPLGKGIAGLAGERREPVTICNLQTDDSGQARPAARQTGMEGAIAVPMLRADGSLHGVLGIAKASAHDWTPAETAELLSVAAAAATVL